jgi:hypothetical protein
VTESAAADTSFDLAPESFWAVAVRRTRYVVAVIIAGLLFHYLGWLVAAPPPNMAGVSLVAWGSAGPGLSGVLPALALAAILIVAALLCSIVIHPDSPHMGLFCALLGSLALSIRGGDARMLYGIAIDNGVYPQISRLLAIECIHWAFIFLIAEIVTRAFHKKFLANTDWLKRGGADLSVVQRVPGDNASLGIAHGVAKGLGTLKLPTVVATPIAFIANVALASLFLYVFLQSPIKGQVIFGCFAAFFVSTHLVYYAFPNVPIFVLLLSIPLTAAIGYLLSANQMPPYPSLPGLYFGRALPIDYIGAGIPGAILGFYLAFQWDLHSRLEPDA